MNCTFHLGLYYCSDATPGQVSAGHTCLYPVVWPLKTATSCGTDKNSPLVQVIKTTIFLGQKKHQPYPCPFAATLKHNYHIRGNPGVVCKWPHSSLRTTLIKIPLSSCQWEPLINCKKLQTNLRGSWTVAGQEALTEDNFVIIPPFSIFSCNYRECNQMRKSVN